MNNTTRPVFLRYLTQRVQHAKVLSRDAHAKRRFDVPIERYARVERKQRQVTNKVGALVLSMTTAYVGPRTDGSGVIDEIATEDQLTLPDGSAPIILNSSTEADVDGTPHHCEVAF